MEMPRGPADLEPLELEEEEAPIDVLRRLATAWGWQRRPPVWEVWPSFGGRSRFCCCGRFHTGPAKVDVKFKILAWLVLVAATAAYFFLCSPLLWAQRRHVPLLLPLLLFGVSSAFMLMTSFTDPGIIPRPAMQLAVPGLRDEVRTAFGLQTHAEDVVYDPSREALLELEERGFRWCTLCDMLQPPRAKHCRDCNSCIARADHHCPFLNVCIGQRNYRFFILALFFLSLYGFSLCYGFLRTSYAVLWLSVDGAVEGSEGAEGSGASASPGTAKKVALAVCSLVTALKVLALLIFGCYHAVLICRGRTTRESLTGKIFGEGATLLGSRARSLLHGTDRVIVCDPLKRADGCGPEGTEPTGADLGGGQEQTFGRRQDLGTGGQEETFGRLAEPKPDVNAPALSELALLP